MCCVGGVRVHCADHAGGSQGRSGGPQRPPSLHRERVARKARGRRGCTTCAGTPRTARCAMRCPKEGQGPTKLEPNGKRTGTVRYHLLERIVVCQRRTSCTGAPRTPAEPRSQCIEDPDEPAIYNQHTGDTTSQCQKRHQTAGTAAPQTETAAGKLQRGPLAASPPLPPPKDLNSSS